MYKKGTGNDKQRKDAGNRTLCPYRNFSQAITKVLAFMPYKINDDRIFRESVFQETSILYNFMVSNLLV